MKRCLLAFLTIICGALQVRADQVGFSPYRIVSSDGRYLFVMLHDRQGHTHGQYDYPANGLYLNDGSKTPLWTVDWVSYAHLPSDGVHVVKQARAWSEAGYDSEAITFFAYGRPIKSYTVRDLLDFPSLLPHTTTMYKWSQGFSRYHGESNTPVMFMSDNDRYFSKSVTFDESTHTMTLRTLQGNVFVFDVNTGEILEARRPVRTSVLVALVVGLIAYCLYVARASKRPRILWWQSGVRLLLYSALLSVLLLAIAFVLVRAMGSLESSVSILFCEAAFRFIWYWPARDPNAVMFSYQFAEAQTFLAWMITFLGIGVVNESVVRVVKRARERGQTPWV
jgi:hypothetical protein